MIRFYAVRKSYGGDFSLGPLDMRVHAGQMCFLCGSSGAGKTTLLNMILGEELPSSGEILVNQRNVPRLRGGHLARHRQRIGVVYQDFRLIERLNVRENIMTMLRICGEARSRDIDRKIDTVARLLEIDNLVRQQVRTLSGGEKQRVSIARAIAHSPELLIADEPTGNLDARQTREIFRIFQRINELGTTVLIASHDMESITRLGAPLYRIRDGRLEYALSL